MRKDQENLIRMPIRMSWRNRLSSMLKTSRISNLPTPQEEYLGANLSNNNNSKKTLGTKFLLMKRRR